MTGGLLHEQYNDREGRAVLFECTECPYRSQSLGSLHAHVETHWSRLEWFRWHVYGWFVDDRDKHMQYTKPMAVKDSVEIYLDDVNGL